MYQLPHGPARRPGRAPHAQPARRPQRLQRRGHRRAAAVGRRRRGRRRTCAWWCWAAPARCSAPGPTPRGWRGWPATRRERERGATRRRTTAMLRALNTLPVGVIGRIHGAALGGGAGLAAVCDIVVAEDAGDLRLHREQARHPAGDDLAVRAAEDRRLGGARAVPDRDALRRRAAPRRSASCTRWCRRPSSTPPCSATSPSCCRRRRSAVAAAKALIPQVVGTAPEDVAALTATTIAAQRVSPEGQEGLRAFLEKRSRRGWLPR